VIKLYGIRNCDTVKKARKWLDEHGIEHQFHDFKKDGLSSELLTTWEGAIGWEALVNRRGTTWRKLPEDIRDGIDAASARRVMLANPSIIKRPVVEFKNAVTIGFNADDWATRFNH
jgi:arsenate reductase